MNGRPMTKSLSAKEKARLKKLGAKIKNLILKEKGYASLDAFSLEYHDLIAKPTLYQICAGERDMKVSTLFRLLEALEVSNDFLNDI